MLVVEDDRPWARTLERLLLRLGVSDVVGTDRIGRGWALAREESWDAVILDLVLPDGDGMALLEALRREQPSLPVLVQTGARDWDLPNDAQRLRAHFVSKPYGAEHLGAFIQMASTEKRRREAPDALLIQLASRYRFTPTERRMLLMLARGMRRAVIARERGVSEGTVKTQIQTMLRKAEASSVLELLGRALYPDRDAGAAAPPPTTA